LQTGQTFDRLLAAFAASAPTVKANAGKFATLDPLQVGKSITYETSGASNSGSDGAWTYKVSIERFENVSTPAGKFPSYVILSVENSFSAGGSRLERRWWYSPTVGHIVKFEYKLISGIPPKPYPSNWHLSDLRVM
jgi:hypothetical protein